MALILQCDICGDTEPSPNWYTKPYGWFDMQVNQDREKGVSMRERAEVCSEECLTKAYERLIATIPKGARG